MSRSPRLVYLEAMEPGKPFRFYAGRGSTIEGTIGDNPGEGIEVILAPMAGQRHSRRIYWSGKTKVEPL